MQFPWRVTQMCKAFERRFLWKIICTEDSFHFYYFPAVLTGDLAIRASCKFLQNVYRNQSHGKIKSFKDVAVIGMLTPPPPTKTPHYIWARTELERFFGTLLCNLKWILPSWAKINQCWQTCQVLGKSYLIFGDLFKGGAKKRKKETSIVTHYIIDLSWFYNECWNTT